MASCMIPALIALCILTVHTNAQIEPTPCVTPDNFNGTCVGVADCPLIANILRDAPKPIPQQIRHYIIQLKCGNRGVCCRQPVLRNVVLNDVIPPSTGDISNHSNLRLLPSSDCGPLMTNKMAGGQNASLGEFPWMALLKYNVSGVLQYSCGGSLINSRYVLTAAHCVTRLQSNRQFYSVILGEQNKDTDPDCDHGICNHERREVFFERVIPHPEYNQRPYANDIALIRLSEDVPLNGDYIKPVCLPVTSELVNETLSYLMVAGWGSTETESASATLLKARLNVCPIDDLRKAFPRQSAFFDENHLCAKGDGIIDTCRGDSGGPLMWPLLLNNAGRYVQFGIVSAGVPKCGELPESLPGVYVRVQKYMNWILDNIRD